MRARLLLLAFAITACSTPPSSDDTGIGGDVPPGSDVPSGTDAPSADDAPSTVDAPRADAGPAADFLTPLDTWTYVPIPGGACGNGSTYGVAIQRSDASSRVVVFMQGGGACWDNITCNLLPIASHVRDTLDAGDVIGEAESEERYTFSRDPAVSPFADATFIYMPYCTGDVHAGDSVNDYSGGTIHHVGYRNVTGVLAGMVAAYGDADRVWVTGASAGGYGTLVNWYRFREAFPTARVDVLDDSGPPVDITPSQWDEMMAAWTVPAPTGCTDCLEALSNVTAFYQRTVTDGDRYALLQYTEDSTIRNYTGLSAANLAMRVRALAEPFAATSSHRIFVLDGSEHVVLGNPSRTSDGVVASDWVRAFATDGAGWDNVVP